MTTDETVAPPRSDCPVCQGRDLLPSITIDSVPVLCNALHLDAISARASKAGRFAITFCRRCSHVFNAAFDEDRIGYTQSYENSLHFSSRFVAFADALANRLNHRYTLTGKTIVDIGCGKGDFLKQLCVLSNAKGVGFDKSFDECRGEPVPGVRFVNDWFHEGHSDISPGFVVCRHVLEHIAEPIDFLRKLRTNPAIKPQTVLYFEVPNALYTLRDLGIWDLIYEHVSYFTPPSLRAAFEAAGFDVIGAGSSFGGQYLYIEARPGSVRMPARSREVATIESLVRRFEGVYVPKVRQWRDYVAQRDADAIVVWGAGSKGITFVNVVPGASRIGGLIDVNPHKQGRFAPGTGTQILPPESLRERSIQSVIVMNPIYRSEIADTVEALDLSAEITVA
jgi:2-polyprenyl-3-methyl-5-hydroxy-6-metoxy-1,4-benzoquinol methylase